MSHGSGPQTFQMKWGDLQARIWGDNCSSMDEIEGILTCTNQ